MLIIYTVYGDCIRDPENIKVYNGSDYSQIIAEYPNHMYSVSRRFKDDEVKALMDLLVDTMADKAGAPNIVINMHDVEYDFNHAKVSAND